MRVLVALSLSLSPEPQTPYFPHETIDYSALPLLKLRVSDCEYNFVPWLFKRVPVSPENFCFSVLPTSLNVGSSINLWLYYFSSASFQLIIQGDCFII